MHFKRSLASTKFFLSFIVFASFLSLSFSLCAFFYWYTYVHAYVYACKVLLSAPFCRIEKRQRISKCKVNHRETFSSLISHGCSVRVSFREARWKSPVSLESAFFSSFPSFFPFIPRSSTVEGRSLRNAHAAAHASWKARTFSRACERAYGFVAINPSNIVALIHSYNKKFMADLTLTCWKNLKINSLFKSERRIFIQHIDKYINRCFIFFLCGNNQQKFILYLILYLIKFYINFTSILYLYHIFNY